MDKRDAALIKAVNNAKNSEFGATGIKVELEAQLGRGSSPSMSSERCDGSYECGECDGDGTTDYCDCGDCEESGAECSHCNATGLIQCDGDCGRLHGTERGPANNWGSTVFCQDWMLKKLVPLGLAAKNTRGIRHNRGYGEYKPKGALKFIRFYRDGSVDSEATFTLSLEDPSAVLLLPQIVQVFKDLGTAVGHGIDVAGAGMHMAWINSRDCTYPYNRVSEHELRFSNFQRSMQLLMPALFFLGASCDTSRGMGYRTPGVGRGKGVAINYNGAIEYRVFDTCYDCPDLILDNVVVMSKTLRYWSNDFVASGMQKVTESVGFGNDMDRTLGRLYQTVTHVDLLNAGLNVLKPSYRTITELKKQRNFTTTKARVRNKNKELERQAKIEYREYEERFNWKLMRWENRFRADMIDKHARTSKEILTENKKTVMEGIEKEVKTLVSKERRAKLPLEKYIQQKIANFEGRNIGQWTLTA